MPNQFYIAGDQRAAGVRDLFGAIARRYDLVNDVQSFGWHRLWKRRVVRLANIQPGDRALDVCSGTGDIAFALARRGADVTALDFSRAMLQVARARSRRWEDRAGRMANGDPVRPPRFVQGDALCLPFRNNSFDVVTIGYGLRNLARWETGLDEMLRVAGPGGRVLVLEFGKPDNRLGRAFYFAYLKFLVPVLGCIFAGNPAAYAYILESLRHYPGPHAVADHMRRAGLTGVRILNLLGGVMTINCGEKPAAGPDAGKIESHCQPGEALARMQS